MAKERSFSLDAVKTDGWFERIGEGIGSFQALCDILGEAFFAFSMITGARVTALTVDRRIPDNTLVDFVVGGDESGGGEPQRLTLGSFRQRLVGALLTEDTYPPAPARDVDTAALQLHIGVRFLLLAPIYGYELKTLLVHKDTSKVVVTIDGSEETFELSAFRARIRTHVREELDRQSDSSRSAIDLTKVAEAEVAEQKGDSAKVVQLLGAWPNPLAIFLRTPEGQNVAAEARGLIAKGLGLLGSACMELGDVEQGEEILRLGVQYAQGGGAASDIFRRLGESLLKNDRAGEAIGALRRAERLGCSPKVIWPLLARAFLKQRRYVAAFGCLREAQRAGVDDEAIAPELRDVEEKLGTPLTMFRGLVVSSGGYT